MARIRTLKPEIWMSPQVMNLPKESRLLFIGLITQADDEGRGTADPRRVKAAIFGGDDDTSANVRRMLDEIAAQGLITIYHDEKHGDLYALRSWRHHQKIDKPKPSGYPAPPNLRPVDDVSATSRRGSEGRDLQEGEDRTVPEGSGGEARAGAEFSGKTSPSKSPSPGNGTHRARAVERRNGSFEEINDTVEKLVRDWQIPVEEIGRLAQMAHVSEDQVKVALGQLRDRGRLPAAGVAA